MLVSIYVASTGGGFLRLKDALGKIKWFMLTFSFWLFMTLPVGYLFFKMGYHPVTILVLFVICDIVCRITQLILMKLIYNYDVILFCKKAFVRPFIIVALMIFYLTIYCQIEIHGFILHFLGLTITFIIGCVLVFFIGLKKNEQKKLFCYIINKLHK